MMNPNRKMTRRLFLQTAGLISAGFAVMPKSLFGETAKRITRPIPSSGEPIPVIGMGTSRTFDIGDEPAARQQLAQVLQTFFDKGGAVIDSSPMYGSAETVVGDLLKSVSNKEALFAATKVWTYGKQNGIQQMQESMRRMGVDVMDLMQIHNLRDWKIHLPTLRQWKEEGKIRYIGITTSHGRSHAELEQIMRTEPLDFVQFTYSIANRTVEERLLPLAADRGIATLINRPFQRGELFQRAKGKSLPDWSAEFDCHSWGQFFLKFVVSHPAVTCVIPATSKVHHMQDNMTAGFGRLPTEAMRRRMRDTVESL
ncbi:MAG: aldo/keto reductase [Desulfobacterales bacterium]|jgi:diketogulonate reductase-like aldo/keto reductase|nr:aldo/keto reductase [Deltaproteobacteria bacterium]